MKKQKFKRGDLVHISKHLPSTMQHFDADLDAIIIGSYKDQFGGNDVSDYTVLFTKDGEECSWYPEEVMTFIKHVGNIGIEKVKLERGEQD